MAEWSLMESRVDWLTATSKVGRHGQNLFELGQTIIQLQKESGEDVSDWYWQGYRGTHTKDVSTGFRMDGAIVRISGFRANLHWRSILTLGGRPSRIDLCVTATNPDERAGWAQQSYPSNTRKVPREGRPVQFGLNLNTDGGETLYCGRRSSQRFGRLYNKHIESGGTYEPGSWRYEVEYKAETAQDVARAMLEDQVDENAIAGVVGAQYAAWGLPVPFLNPSAMGRLPAPAAKISDAERRLAWLEDSVAPAIERLATHYREEDILRALGVWYTPVRPPVVNEFAPRKWERQLDA